MLILTRKRNESIKIGNNILIKVVQTKPGLVKLGIEAPSDIRVLRAELSEFTTAANEPVNHPTEADSGMEHVMTASTDDSGCYLAFSTEYAAEIEDQMLCVATD